MVQIRDQFFLYMDPEPVFVDPLRSPEIDSQPGGPVRQTFLLYRPARQHRLAASIPRNQFLGSINVDKYGLSFPVVFLPFPSNPSFSKKVNNAIWKVPHYFLKKLIHIDECCYFWKLSFLRTIFCRIFYDFAVRLTFHTKYFTSVLPVPGRIAGEHAKNTKIGSFKKCKKISF